MLYLKNIASLELKVDKCNGCGMCIKVCPHAVFMMEKKKAKIDNLDACMECGACSLNCEQKALSVTPGVGCAAALLNAKLGRTSAPCCGPVDGSGSSGCC